MTTLRCIDYWKHAAQARRSYEIPTKSDDLANALHEYRTKRDGLANATSQEPAEAVERRQRRCCQPLAPLCAA